MTVFDGCGPDGYVSDEQLNVLVPTLGERIDVNADLATAPRELKRADTVLAALITIIQPHVKAHFEKLGITESGQRVNAALHWMIEQDNVDADLCRPLTPQEAATLIDWFSTRPKVRSLDQAPVPMPPPQQPASAPTLKQIGKAALGIAAVALALLPKESRSSGPVYQPVYDPQPQPVYVPVPTYQPLRFGMMPPSSLPMTSDPRYWCPQLWNQ
jgi:hypothetical protein